MKSAFAVIALCLALAVNAAPRIVGGQNAPDGKYPYQVSLKYHGSHLCGGSILNKRWILTAAHCLLRAPPSLITAHVGSNKLNETFRAYQAEYMTYYEKYGNFTNDIGLVRVDRDIEFNNRVQPIKLPSEDFTKVDYPVIVSGWGRLSDMGAEPNDLQEIELKVISQEECNSMVGPYPTITKAHICTLTKNGEGVCSGDSGSPLVADGVQIGIASFVYPCAIGYPDAYARVYTFIDWINERINDF